MANQTPVKFISPESSNCSGIISMNANGSVLQASSPSRVSNGSVGILWDIENCPVPSDVRPEVVAGNIRMALRVHPVITGAVTLFSAYGDFNAFPRRLREGCQRTGVKLVDVPNGRKDAADKAILVDMFLFALDNPPPSSILLISGDVDFAPALHILGQRGYRVILVLPARVDVSSALSSAGRFVWDWPSVARGVGFVPPRSSMSHGPTVAGYLVGCHLGESNVGQNEDEAIIYTGNSHREYTARVNINQAHCFNSSHVSREPSRCIHSMSEHSGNNLTGTVPSKSQSLPCGLREAPTVDQTQMQDEVMWVQPGDIYGLKGQIMKLLEIFSGSLPLVRLPSEYLKRYGRPLYVAEYGALKLVNLIKKMGSPLCIVGKGHYKMVCLRNTVDRQERVGTCTPALAGKGRKGKEAAEDNSVDICVCPNMGSSSDDFSEDEKIDIVEASDVGAGPVSDYNQCLESFRHEMQELLVCLSYCVPLSEFESSYEQRYKKSIDYQLFGVDGLEDLIKKVSDVVELCQEQETKVKYLVSRLPAV